MTLYAPQSVEQWLASAKQRVRDADRLERGSQRDWAGYRHYHRDRPLTPQEREAMYAERKMK